LARYELQVDTILTLYLAQRQGGAGF